MRNQFFFALYTTWAIVWVFVAFSYSGATYRSWRAQQGRFRSIPKEIAGFFRWFFFNTYQDVRHGFHNYPEAIPDRYTNGHLLRFFITLGAFLAGIIGIGAAIFERVHWSDPVASAVFFAVAVSIFVALGHLSVAWAFQPRKWRLLVMGLALWFPTACTFRGVL